MAASTPKRFELPPSRLFADGWTGTIRDRRALQQQRAAQVSLVDAFDALPRWVAGVDVGLGRFGTIARAAVVLLDTRTLDVAEQAVVEQPVRLPYIPGLLSFRELPSILAALAQLRRAPALIVCDGQGIAHPRRLGIASHLGVTLDMPCIGVAKSILSGEHGPLADEQGAYTPLRIAGVEVGTVLRSRARCKPLIISPGHRVSIERAHAFVAALVKGYRLPEPTRLADRLSKAPREPTSPATMGLFN